MLQNPERYACGPNFQLYNLKRFAWFVILALYQSSVTVGLLIVSLSGFGYSQEYGLFGFGILVYTCIIIILNLKLSLFNSYYLAWPILFFPIFTIIFWFAIYQPVYSIFFGGTNMGAEVYGIFPSLFINPITYFNIILVVTVALIPEIVISWISFDHRKVVETRREVDELPIYEKL